MKLALAFACGPVHPNTHHHSLSAHSACVVLSPLIESEPKLEPAPDPAIAVTDTAALVAVHGPVIVYTIVATPDVEKMAYAKSPMRPPA